jgi:predicted nucleic acid-binding protein
VTTVIDASAMVAFVLKEKGLDIERMNNLLRDGVMSPALMEAESANAILISKRRGLTDMQLAMEALGDVIEFSKNNVKMRDESELIQDAFGIADKHGLEVYDALYLSLAIKTKSSLATKDVKQVEAARKLGIKIEMI